MTRRGRATYFLAALLNGCLLVIGYRAASFDLSGAARVPFGIWVVVSSIASWVVATWAAHRLVS